MQAGFKKYNKSASLETITLELFYNIEKTKLLQHLEERAELSKSFSYFSELVKDFTKNLDFV